MATQRIKTLTFDDESGRGMTLAEVAGIVSSMTNDGIPEDAILRVETVGSRGELRISSLTGSDRNDDRAHPAP